MKIIEVAKKYVGYDYRRFCGQFGGGCWAWCAAFISVIAKESGATMSDLDAMQRQIIDSEYRNDSIQAHRMIILNDLEPFRHLSYAEVNDLYRNSIITIEELKLKLNFMEYVRRFERENVSIAEFGSILPYKDKIEKITKKLKEYAN